ncbi:MAG: DHHW family protein [Clostridia bacterium]|nr:DHHW family protein [Clostridia bacterium]
MQVEEFEVVDISEEEQNLDDNMKLLKNFRSQHIIDINMVRVFVLIWIVAMVFALMPMFRSSYSDVEKRELKKFPKFSFSALVSGDYFDDIGLWFSDTFPMRDGFVSLNTNLTNTFGINTVQVQGNVIKGDEIPESDKDSKKDSKKDSEKGSEKDSEKVESKPEQTPAAPPPAVEQLGAMLIVDNAAYEYYNFSQATADNYIATLNRAAALLEGKAWVYDMIVPTSMAITLPENFTGSTNSSDQKKAIDYMYSKMNKNVYSVDAYSALLKHKKEYLYFRTDHHWTALGAYYSYRELMAVKGAKPVPLTTFKEHKFDGFLGSFYAHSGQKACLGNTPDYVMAYEPPQTNTIQTITKNGTINYSIVSDGNVLSAGNKYLSFICGDQPYGIINNPDITDGSSCLIIKESYGNAIVAFLTQHFQNVYVVDYRYIDQVFPGTLVQFVDERKIGEVFFVNNISATRSAGLVGAISRFVG